MHTIFTAVRKFSVSHYAVLFVMPIFLIFVTSFENILYFSKRIIEQLWEYMNCRFFNVVLH